MATSKHLPSPAKSRVIRGLPSMIDSKSGVAKRGLLGVFTLIRFGLLVRIRFVRTRRRPPDFAPSIRAFTAQGGRRFAPTRSHRTLRDGSFLEPFPGSKLSGYYHSVPPGQKPSLRAFPNIDSTLPIEDEEDDEYEYENASHSLPLRQRP